MHLTIVIPAFNTARYIQKCIESVFVQIHKDIDILVVDDGSTDETLKVIHKFIPEYPVSVIQLDKNKGVTYATHQGIISARGPIITILDSDDLLLPNSLHMGVVPFDDPEVGFVWTKFMKSTGKMGWSRAINPTRSLWQEMMYHNWWKASHQRFFRKTTYLESLQLNTAIKRSSDYQLVMLLALTGCKTIHVPYVTYWYRMKRQGSITSEGSDKQKQAVVSIKEWITKQIHKRGIHEPK